MLKFSSNSAQNVSNRRFPTFFPIFVLYCQNMSLKKISWLCLVIIFLICVAAVLYFRTRPQPEKVLGVMDPAPNPIASSQPEISQPEISPQHKETQTCDTKHLLAGECGLKNKKLVVVS